MSDVEPVTFTETELESFIPAGWVLAPDRAGTWDRRAEAFRFTIVDTADLDWEVVVKATEAARLGRIEALRDAVDRLHRLRFERFF